MRTHRNIWVSTRRDDTDSLRTERVQTWKHFKCRPVSLIPYHALSPVPSYGIFSGASWYTVVQGRASSSGTKLAFYKGMDFEKEKDMKKEITDYEATMSRKTGVSVDQMRKEVQELDYRYFDKIKKGIYMQAIRSFQNTMEHTEDSAIVAKCKREIRSLRIIVRQIGLGR